MAPNTEAIEALTALGLTEYEAQCFVALTQLSQGTAKEISRIADVPQSRVYDVTEQLHHKGLIDIEEADPQRYFALPVQAAADRLRQEYSDHLETITEQLQTLESRQQDEDGAWTIANREDVLTRLQMHIDNATDEVYISIAHEALLETPLLNALGTAHNQDISIYVEIPSESLQDEIHNSQPGLNVAVSDLPVDTSGNRGPGRLLMVDKETILLSAWKDGLVPHEIDETGLWGSEVGHGLVAWLEPLLTARMSSLAFTTAES
jgi:sugar-specific transcriptional regulator TrmB